MAKKSFFNSLFNVGKKVYKANKKLTKSIEKQQKQNIANQKKQEQQRLISDMESKGYILVSTNSLKKYIQGAIISENLMDELTDATLEGKTKIFVSKSELSDMECKLKEYKKNEKSLHDCARLNNEGMALEKEGKIKEAIEVYEKNLKNPYPARMSYDRLMILYHKEKDYENELRVINLACAKFTDEKYPIRKEKTIKLMNK
jgi:tetratricopeptide (TPR) repeat protein